MGNINIELSDANTYLKGLNIKVDCIIIDPPYPLNIQNGTRRFGTSSRLVDKYGNNSGYLFLNKNEFYPMFKTAVENLFNVLKDNCDLYVFVNYSERANIKKLLDKRFKFIKELIWDKIDIGLGYKYRNSHEYILYYSKGKTKNNFSDLTVLRYRVPRATEKGIYPTQKPVELLKRLISNSTKPGDKVLDCFAGSGSTLKAGLLLDRAVYGCDNNPEAYKLIIKEIKILKSSEVLTKWVKK